MRIQSEEYAASLQILLLPKNILETSKKLWESREKFGKEKVRGYLRGLCLERRKEAKTMSVSTDTERIFRIGGYVKRAKLNLRNEREIRAFHRNAIERRFGDFEDGTLVDVYIDITSYKETAKRPEMLRLMRDCTDGKVNLIFAETKGYLSANTREFCYWLHFIFIRLENLQKVWEENTTDKSSYTAECKEYHHLQSDFWDG